mmetsp:Transcript_142113/g.441919  ORF Transcript_142113/g.441919 Transcript_142113/m.441919 type:complete len:225 (-) Transcript_142113:148-822(-)
MSHYQNVAAVLKQVGSMRHIVFSTLEETTKTEGCEDFKTLAEHDTGKMYVSHVDGKARAEAYFEGLPMTHMVTSGYFENFTTFFAFAKQEDGSYAFTLPLGDMQIPWTILSDLGLLVDSVFAKPELVGKRVGQASFLALSEEIAGIFSEATGKTIKYNKVPWETFASFGFPGADELAQMFEFWLRTYDVFVSARSLEAQQGIVGEAYSVNTVEYAKTLHLKIDG